MMIDAIHKALVDEVLSMTQQELAVKVKISGSHTNKLMRCLRTYHRAHESRWAKEQGIIGVGLISFAEGRLNTFMRRINFTI